MDNSRSGSRLPEPICAIFGFSIAMVLSFVLALLLGTAWSFGLFLHILLAVLGGYLLGMHCTENDRDLFGLIGLFYASGKEQRGGAAVGPAAEAVKPVPERTGEVVDLAERAGDRVAKTARDGRKLGGGRDEGQGDSPRPESALPARTVEGSEIEPGHKPELHDAPQGDPDDLTRISGIGPKLAEMLNGLGIWHFWQIAAWGPAELAWVDSHLGAFRGRAERDDWVGQAQRVAAGEPPTSS